MYIVERIGDKDTTRLNGFSDESIKSVLQTGKTRWNYEELAEEIHRLSYSPLFECTIEPQDLPRERGLLLETLQRLEELVKPSAIISSKDEYTEYRNYHTIQIREQK